MKKILFYLLFQTTLSAFCQGVIEFENPLKIKSIDKKGMSIKVGSTFSLTSLKYLDNVQYATPKIFVKDDTGKELEFESKLIENFVFEDVNDVPGVWDKHCLINGSYANILSKGYQYRMRHEMHEESIEFINAIDQANMFFNDDFLEDYLYGLISKIHTGFLHDKRPGNMSVKILKDAEPNAFVLPNGCVVVSTGLLSAMQSENELMGVLSHEIAHFVLDHQILNYNAAMDRAKRAEFWTGFATAVAATGEILLATNDLNYSPGLLTATTLAVSSIISEEVTAKLGVKYSQEQETQADFAAKDILKVLGYNELGLSVALSRIKTYCWLTGNYLALTSSGTHPSLNSRIEALGANFNLSQFQDGNYLKRISMITSYNAGIELWNNARHDAALELVNRNIENEIAIESDYLIKAIILRRISSSQSTNEQVIDLLKKAAALNVKPLIAVSKELGITYLRLSNKVEAKKCFEDYLKKLQIIEQDIRSCSCGNSAFVNNEIEWVNVMIFKVDKM